MPIGNRTLTAGETAPFVVVALVFLGIGAAYLGVAAVSGGPDPADRVVFRGEAPWLGLVLGIPMCVGSGGMVAMGIAEVLGGSMGGTGAVCAAPFLLLPSLLLFNLGLDTHQRPDGALVLRRGGVWPRARVFSPIDLTELRVTGRSNRGVRHWTLELPRGGSAVVVFGSWRTADEAKRALALVQAGLGLIGAMR